VTPAEIQAAFSEVREALQDPEHLASGAPYRGPMKALARIESEVARLAEERDHYRFHFDQQEERAEATEKANRALGARNSELLAKLARLERIEEAARKQLNWPVWTHPQLRKALAAEEGGDRE
jgi:hypothetical protein